MSTPSISTDPPGALRASFVVTAVDQGPPRILWTRQGLQIYPADGDLCFFMSPEDWRALNTAVEAVIEAEAAA